MTDGAKARRHRRDGGSRHTGEVAGGFKRMLPPGRRTSSLQADAVRAERTGRAQLASRPGRRSSIPLSGGTTTHASSLLLREADPALETKPPVTAQSWRFNQCNGSSIRSRWVRVATFWTDPRHLIAASHPGLAHRQALPSSPRAREELRHQPRSRPRQQHRPEVGSAIIPFRCPRVPPSCSERPTE